MDFDDLDDQAPIQVNNQVVKGSVLKPVFRSFITPVDSMLDERIRKKLPPLNGEPLVTREPKLRVLITMGAGDHIIQEWVNWAHEAPPDIEVITHEPPGHGTRGGEAVPTTLKAMGDDAFEGFKEAMDTGPFVLLGHSIGCLTVVYVAERAKRELNVEPLFVFMLERGAAHSPAFSEYGYEMLKSDPLKFLKIRDPSTAKACEAPGEVGRKALDMWGHDLLLENDIREVGFHKFSCPIVCFRCEVNFFKDCPAELLEQASENIKIHNLEKNYLGHFGPKEFEMWNEWTDHPAGAKTHVVTGSTHFSIKKYPSVKQEVWAELRKIIDTF